MNTTHALEINIDPERIGMMGFSAGGYLTAFIGTHFDNGMMEPESRNTQFMSMLFGEPTHTRDFNDPVAIWPILCENWLQGLWLTSFK